MTRKEIVGENIRNLRNAHGMSQTEFADAIKRKQSTIAMYESGDRLPPATIITSIANLFCVSFDDIYYSEEERKQGHHTKSTVTFDAGKAEIPDKPYHGIADRLVEIALSEEDDELMRELEAIRRDPERRRLFKRASHSDIDEVRQANAILDALKETKR